MADGKVSGDYWSIHRRNPIANAVRPGVIGQQSEVMTETVPRRNQHSVVFRVGAIPKRR